jgi:hypothetical protein
MRPCARSGSPFNVRPSRTSAGNIAGPLRATGNPRRTRMPAPTHARRPHRARTSGRRAADTGRSADRSTCRWSRLQQYAQTGPWSDLANIIWMQDAFAEIDKPFLDNQGRRLENFTRIETFGDNQGNGNNDVHWLKVLVSPRTREVFAYQPQIVTANRTAVPSPSRSR